MSGREEQRKFKEIASKHKTFESLTQHLTPSFAFVVQCSVCACVCVCVCILIGSNLNRVNNTKPFAGLQTISFKPVLSIQSCRPRDFLFFICFLFNPRYFSTLGNLSVRKTSYMNKIYLVVLQTVITLAYKLGLQDTRTKLCLGVFFTKKFITLWTTFVYRRALIIKNSSQTAEHLHQKVKLNNS